MLSGELERRKEMKAAKRKADGKAELPEKPPKVSPVSIFFNYQSMVFSFHSNCFIIILCQEEEKATNRCWPNAPPRHSHHRDDEQIIARLIPDR